MTRKIINIDYLSGSLYIYKYRACTMEISRQNFFERHATITISIFVLFVFILIDFIVGFFFIKPSYQDFRTEHYFYHHGLRPNQKSYGRWSSEIYPFCTNSLGFRDSVPRKVPKKSNLYRILILGDSHSEGVDVPFANSFPGILAAKAPGYSAEVLNASVVSYSPKIYWLKLKYLLEKEKVHFNEVFILIDISDIQNELVYERFNPAGFSDLKNAWVQIRNFFKKNSFLVHSFSQFRLEREKNKFFERIHYPGSETGGQKISETMSAELYYSFFTHFNDNVLLANPRFHGVGDWLYEPDFHELALRGIRLGQENILKVKQLCDQFHVQLTISVHPWHSQIKARLPEDEYTRLWEDFANQHQIRFVNLYPLFINGKNPEIIINKYYIKSDNHFNEFGHELVARFLEPIIFANCRKHE